MSAANSTIQIRIDAKTKSKLQATLEKLGLDISSATKLFFNRVVKTKSIPFMVRTANGYTPEYEQMILKELESMKAGNELTFKSAKQALKYLNE